LGYDNLHRLTSDTLATSGGTTVASIGYGYDPNGNLTGKTTTGFAGAAASTYTYDQANRLASWNNGTTTVNYGYDGAGNLTQSGGKTLAYDARDQLTSTTSGTTTTSYAYTARGTMAAAGTAAVSSDAYGQTVTQAGQSYAYDGLGRMLSASGTAGPFTLSYRGAGSQIAADGTWNYAYDPAGGLAATGPAGGTQAQGTLAWTDAHTDVVATFTPTATSLAGSASYDPFGGVTASAGLAGNLGYQSGFTDPATKLVHMGARWYSPANGQFTSKDTVTVNPVPDPAAASPFGYAADSPLVNTDPTGHMIVAPTSGGSYSAHHPVYRLPPPPPPRPPAPSCGGWTSWFGGCLVQHIVNTWHRAVNVYHRVVHTVSSAASLIFDKAALLLAEARAAAARAVGHVIHTVATGLADAASWGYHAAAAVVSAASHAAHAVTQWTAHAWHRTVAVVKTAYHLAAQAATATAAFIKHHAATIASFAAGAVVFTGCMLASSGALVVGCAAAAGAVSNLVSYSMSCGSSATGCSLAGAVITTGLGALAGAVGGAVAGRLAGSLAGSILGDVLPSAAQGAIVGAGAGAAAGGRAGAGGYAAGCSTSSSGCSLSGLASATASGAAGGAIVGGALGAAGALAPGCGGGESFTAATRVLLANGKTSAISKLHTGQKVLATDTRTGKNQARPIAAVLVHHDTNLYDLRVKTAHGTAIIHTTRNHLFWDATARRWIKAAALRYGTHLRTPTSTTATTLGGHAPTNSTGWMWDLTIPRNHDFYIQAATTTILVHNISCGVGGSGGAAADPYPRDAQGRFTSGAGGDSAAAALGRSAHISYENTLGGGDYVFNRTLPESSLRPDAYSADLRIVRELKPASPGAIASGWRQVNNYRAYMEQYTGEPWTGYVDVYSP
jgi:RHS repeat-associated protein